MENFLTD